MQAILDAKERQDQLLEEATQQGIEEGEDGQAEFFDVCNNGGKPKRRTFTTD